MGSAFRFYRRKKQQPLPSKWLLLVMVFLRLYLSILIVVAAAVSEARSSHYSSSRRENESLCSMWHVDLLELLQTTYLHTCLASRNLLNRWYLCSMTGFRKLIRRKAIIRLTSDSIRLIYTSLWKMQVLVTSFASSSVSLLFSYGISLMLIDNKTHIPHTKSPENRTESWKFPPFFESMIDTEANVLLRGCRNSLKMVFSQVQVLSYVIKDSRNFLVWSDFVSLLKIKSASSTF